MRTNISQDNRAEWLEFRKKYVTSSEAAIVAIPSSYTNASDVFIEKMAKEPREDFQNDDMIRGSVLESFLRRKIEKQFPQMGELQHNKYVYVESLDGMFSATPDAFIIGDDGNPTWAFEIKCPRTLPNERTQYGKNKRLRYLIQLWLGMRCSGVSAGSLCVGSLPYDDENISIETFSIKELDNMFVKYLPKLTEFYNAMRAGSLPTKFW